MAEIVRMPKLSDTMTEGVVAEWHAKVGDKVESGDVLAEIETDKATMEFESFLDGVLLYIGIKKGQTAPVDSVLAVLGEEGEDFKELLENAEKEAPKAEPVQKSVTPTPIAPVIEAPKPTPVALPKKEVKKAVKTKPNISTGRVLASPLAKKLAEELKINLSYVSGTGDNGRIIKRDIEDYSSGVSGNLLSAKESYSEEPISQMRKTIAARLSESKFTAPHFYLTISIDMDNAMQARKAINTLGGPKVSFNDFVVKAVAMSLKKHPNVNSSWQGTTIRRNEHVHIGVAVAVTDGLLVPVVRHANLKSLEQINAEVKDLAGKAKDKKLMPEDWEGNTFTISNLGMFGIEEFTAIVNPPDACILAVGGISQVPVVKDGQIVPGNIMKVTLSCDHRVVDGATGAEFLNTFKGMMENPVLMFV